MWGQQERSEWPSAPLRGRGPAAQGLETGDKDSTTARESPAQGGAGLTQRPVPDATSQAAAVPRIRNCVFVCFFWWGGTI